MADNNNVSKPQTDEEVLTLEMQKIEATVDTSLYLKKKPVFSFFKRFFDILLSLEAILILSPLLIIIAFLVKITSRGPIFYKHRRIGKKGKAFNMLKFRTMKWDRRPIEEQLSPEQLKQFYSEFKVDNDPRITKFGKFLRKTSLDELPQLFNIFIGQMSIVGPRPIIDIESEKYGLTRDVLLSVRPGLTSYWACHGRSNVNYTERVNMELYYIKHRSLWLDIKLIARTALKVFKREGAE
ncbi:MAG: sugar transferase [Bacilli bacterium]|jgi:lipopolysaccharide/colanic/teichoic acid biosynthesis glycosyltransferase|nr:sugar transferase [Bacilli bacterium]